MKVVHAFGRVYDAFKGEGWENWTRFMAVKNNQKTVFMHVSGAPIDKELFDRLNASFVFKKHYQTV